MIGGKGTKHTKEQTTGGTGKFWVSANGIWVVNVGPTTTAFLKKKTGRKYYCSNGSWKTMKVFVPKYVLKQAERMLKELRK